jgi:2-oxoglutarate ferredoxin oxidoreductase subunit alpha
MKKENKQFLFGSQIAVQASIDAGAQMMYGYPITPATEVFTDWIGRGQKYLQTEDEIAAGFAVCGAVLAGQKAFTATAGPGHVLMQDGLSMAEGMRLPFVMIVGQRGGPSSGTVIYSQQEVILACFGGNGEGLRFVYSPSSLQELYTLTRQAFNDAWHYHFPAIVLTDGYMLKTRGVVDFTSPSSSPSKGEENDDYPPLKKESGMARLENIPSHPLIPKEKVIHWPNIYTFEEELNAEIISAQNDFHKIASDIVACEKYQTDDADILLIAHGIVASCAKEAVDALRKQGKKVGLFRPITLRPFPKNDLDKVGGRSGLKKIVVVESSAGQLARIVRDQLAPEISAPFEYLQYPGLGVETEEIIGRILENN